MKKILIASIIIFLVIKSFGQSKIWFYDGSIKEAQSVKVGKNFVYYEAKNKTKISEKQDVFAVIQNKDTSIFYNPKDTSYLTINEMKDYLTGKYDGKQYRNNTILILGVLNGIASPFILASIGLPTAFSPVFALGYIVAAGNIKAKKAKPQKNTKYYKLGFNEEVQKQRTLIAIYGSIIGLLIGLIAVYFILEYKK